MPSRPAQLCSACTQPRCPAVIPSTSRRPPPTLAFRRTSVRFMAPHGCLPTRERFQLGAYLPVSSLENLVCSSAPLRRDSPWRQWPGPPDGRFPPQSSSLHSYSNGDFLGDHRGSPPAHIPSWEAVLVPGKHVTLQLNKPKTTSS